MCLIARPWSSLVEAGTLVPPQKVVKAPCRPWEPHEGQVPRQGLPIWVCQCWGIPLLLGWFKGKPKENTPLLGSPILRHARFPLKISLCPTDTRLADVSSKLGYLWTPAIQNTCGTWTQRSRYSSQIHSTDGLAPSKHLMPAVRLKQGSRSAWELVH